MSISQPPYQMISADMNGDGQIDLVTANIRSKTVTIVLNMGGGAFFPASFEFGKGPRCLAAGDLNADIGARQVDGEVRDSRDDQN